MFERKDFVEKRNPCCIAKNHNNFYTFYGNGKSYEGCTQGDWFKIDTDIYLYTHNSTNAKMRILNKVFDAYGKDKNELVFNLKPEK